MGKVKTTVFFNSVHPVYFTECLVFTLLQDGDKALKIGFIIENLSIDWKKGDILAKPNTAIQSRVTDIKHSFIFAANKSFQHRIDFARPATVGTWSLLTLSKCLVIRAFFKYTLKKQTWIIDDRFLLLIL